MNANYKDGSMLCMNMGGCGKSHVIHAINTILFASGVKIILNSTTRLTANHINGPTIHSVVDLPVQLGYKELSRGKLIKLQHLFENVKGLIIDEFSMLKASDFWILNLCLEQKTHNDLLFGFYVYF